jgi:ribosomal protein S12 methylthiotransferase
LVDSERILTRLRAEGYDVVGTYEDANLVVVNTCGFIDEAVHESLEAIGEAVARNGKVIVTGCLGARPETIKSRHPSVLKVTGAHAYEEVIQAVHEHLPPLHDPFVDLVPPQGIRLTPRHYAYLKISEGCNHRCTFCIIPSMRGNLASRPIGEVMLEAERLVKAGVKELLVISQDTSAYGSDLKYATGFWGGRPVKARFVDLARALGSLGAWVRLHYVYPYPHVDDVIPLMAEGKVLPYLDVPFQHGSPRVLRLMKRPAHAENTLARIAAWREVCPDLTLRSTFIVGFPGETESTSRCCSTGCAKRGSTASAASSTRPSTAPRPTRCPTPVPEEVKQERYERFMEVAATISRDKLAARVGQRMQVLVDQVDAGLGAVARSTADAPEIDGSVRIARPGKSTKAGDWAHVEVTGSDDYDLHAKIVRNAA